MEIEMNNKDGFNHDIEQQMLELLDGNLQKDEGVRLMDKINADPSLQAKWKALQIVHHSLQQTQWEHPGNFFTKQVMEGIDHFTPKTSIHLNRIFLLLGIMVLVILGSWSVSSGIFDFESTLSLNPLSPPSQKFIPQLPDIILKGKWIVNIIIVLNLILGWFILDRTILRPWFENRSRSF